MRIVNLANFFLVVKFINVKQKQNLVYQEIIKNYLDYDFSEILNEIILR